MEIVIKIPEDDYKRIVKYGMTVFGSDEDIDLLERALENGVVLPKGHGRLKDADAFIKAECSQCDGYCDVCECDCLHCKSEYRCDFIKNLDSAEVILEADKEGDDDYT